MLPADLANRALNAIGSPRMVGDLEDGTAEARAILREYLPVMRQLLRGARWAFARKQSPLVLLGDATGQTPNAGCAVIKPWVYEYEYPIDCMQARFVPWNDRTTAAGYPAGNTSIPPGVPLTGASPTANAWPPVLRPARFLIATDSNYPAQIGAITAWGDAAQWWEVQGVSPQLRTVVLTDVPCAELVYTAFIPYPSLWDALFEEAFVALIAARIAMPLIANKGEARAVRGDNIAIAKNAVTQARVADGNEGVATTDHMPEWITRRSYSSWGVFGGADGGFGAGVAGYGWDAISWPDGSVY